MWVHRCLAHRCPNKTPRRDERKDNSELKTRLGNDFVGMLHEHARRRANPFSAGSDTVFGHADEVIERRGKEWAESVLWQKLSDTGKAGSRAEAELLRLADEAETFGRHRNSADDQERPQERASTTPARRGPDIVFEGIRWGLRLEQNGPIDVYDSETAARSAAKGRPGGELVRIETTVCVQSPRTGEAYTVR